jgi:hypothetical protein
MVYLTTVQPSGSVGIATGYGLNDGGVGVPSPGRVTNFLFSMSSRPGLWSTPSPSSVPGALSPGVKRPGVKLSTHLHLVPRSKKCGPIYPLPHTP